ncbi:MAG: four helix bundle protein [Gemmatimonadaceae bacterium]|nr:four helix bundle protein [Gemmatimonadaceae bacterium]
MSEGKIDHRQLLVWQRAHILVLTIYRVTRTFPAEERYGLTSQLRRAAVAIATNIAEGRSRSTPGAYASFVDIALGSAGEVSYELLLARDLEYMQQSVYEPLVDEIEQIRNMLGGLRQSIINRSRDATPPRPSIPRPPSADP